MKALKDFIQPFETPQSRKRFEFIFILIQLSEKHGAGTVKNDRTEQVKKIEGKKGKAKPNSFTFYFHIVMLKL